MHEASLYEDNCFITLTYDDQHLPAHGDLVYPHFQSFMRKLRREYPNRNIRFYMCGEYGSINKRPHYHAILFNFNFPDKKPCGLTKTGLPEFNSETLKKLWGRGRTSLGDATEQSAAYCARYITEKISGASDHIDPKTGRPYRERYLRAYNGNPDSDGVLGVFVTPEFNRMSLKPGIGQGWFDQFYKDVYPEDSVRTRNGRRIKPPRYYDKKYDALEPYEFEDVKQARIVKALKNWEESQPNRLAVKEEVLKAKMSKFNRNLES